MSQPALKDTDRKAIEAYKRRLTNLERSEDFESGEALPSNEFELLYSAKTLTVLGASYEGFTATAVIVILGFILTQNFLFFFVVGPILHLGGIVHAKQKKLKAKQYIQQEYGVLIHAN